MNTPKILVVITARGGSKGVLRKNIRMVAGQPLIGYAIKAALGAGDRIYKVIVSTDDEEIAEVAKKCGADVPFLRPAELASDTAASLPVVQHAVDSIENQDGVKIDWSLLIQPTNPFVTGGDIIRMIDMIDENVTSVVSVVDATSVHPLKILKMEDGYLQPYCADAEQGVRRQDLGSVYRRNGALYMTRRDILMKDNNLYGTHIKPYVMGDETAIDIDTELDLRLADFMLRNR